MTEQSSVVEYIPSSLDVLGSKRPEQVLRLKYDVAHIMDAVLKGPTPENPSGVHYGPSFPGSKKNSLLLPGAHTLASTFGLTPTYDITEIPEGKGRRYQVRTKIHSRAGLFLGEGIGEASTEEEKFAWQEVVCDPQYAAADPMDVRIKYKKVDRDPGYVEIKQIRTAVADKSNTALKIGKKRSFVDAVILVLDCSDIFDQDFEELGDELGFERVKPLAEAKEPKKLKLPPCPTFSIGKHKGARIDDPEVPIDYLKWFSNSIADKLKAADPAHAKFKAQDTLFLAALDAEITKRTVPTPKTDEKPPQEQAKSAPSDVQTANPATSTRKPFSDSSWADTVLFFEEEAADHYATVKAQFKIQSGHDLTGDKRIEFYDAVMALVHPK